jgi:hypothetical protein
MANSAASSSQMASDSPSSASTSAGRRSSAKLSAKLWPQCPMRSDQPCSASTGCPATHCTITGSRGASSSRAASVSAVVPVNQAADSVIARGNSSVGTASKPTKKSASSVVMSKSRSSTSVPSTRMAGDCN